MQPTLTVIVPTYNRCDMLRRTLESCLAQTNRTFELLIADNASCDGTQAFLRSFVARWPEVRLQLNDKNLGAVRSIAQALRSVQTEWATILCDDDWIEPNYIAEFKAAGNLDGIGLVVTGFSESFEDGTFHVVCPDRAVFRGPAAISVLLSGRVKTAGISGFFFRPAAVHACLKEYPKGYFTDTYLVCEVAANAGLCTAHFNGYIRSMWRGSETSAGDTRRNKALYKAARRRFKRDVLNLVCATTSLREACDALRACAATISLR